MTGDAMSVEIGFSDDKAAAVAPRRAAGPVDAMVEAAPEVRWPLGSCLDCAQSGATCRLVAVGEDLPADPGRAAPAKGP